MRRVLRSIARATAILLVVALPSLAHANPEGVRALVEILGSLPASAPSSTSAILESAAFRAAITPAARSSLQDLVVELGEAQLGADTLGALAEAPAFARSFVADVQQSPELRALLEDVVSAGPSNPLVRPSNLPMADSQGGLAGMLSTCAGPDCPVAALFDTTAAATRITAGASLAPSAELVDEYAQLFEQYGIPTTAPNGERANRIVMVSTHGYWGDPPPAGVPDTGGQTFYVLNVSKQWAQDGRQVIILARHFEGAPRVERFADNVWLVRIQAGGEDFVRKEDIYPLVPEMAEAATAIGDLFHAQAVVGHYADGMTIAAETAARLDVPLVQISHSLGTEKALRLDRALTDPADMLADDFRFAERVSLETRAMNAANMQIANSVEEPEAWVERYGLAPDRPHTVMPAGAGQVFFDVASEAADPAVLAERNLEDGQYILFWARMAEAKNAEGVVQVLGELRRRYPQETANLKVVIGGGSAGFEAASDEERLVKERIREVMTEYGLSEDDVLLMGNQPHETLAQLARGALAFVGPQRVEPFGMAAAEAMAAGSPLLISQEAGISAWVDDGRNAIVIDPRTPGDTAEHVYELLTDPAQREGIAQAGHELAVESFSWNGIASQQAEILDDLVASGASAGDRAFHRTSPVWRGTFPEITPSHIERADSLLTGLASQANAARANGERLVVGLSNEGDLEVAYALEMMLPRSGVRATTVPGGAFATATDLETTLAQTRDSSVSMITVPTSSELAGHSYDSVPVDLAGVDVVFVDLTDSALDMQRSLPRLPAPPVVRSEPPAMRHLPR